MLNLVELVADREDMKLSPCKFGNIVIGHACYCHNESHKAPRKCPIWSRYGESDLSKWKRSASRGSWDDGCPYFESNKE